jgi:hypothetical protein
MTLTSELPAAATAPRAPRSEARQPSLAPPAVATPAARPAGRCLAGTPPAAAAAVPGTGGLPAGGKAAASLLRANEMLHQRLLSVQKSSRRV